MSATKSKPTVGATGFELRDRYLAQHISAAKVAQALALATSSAAHLTAATAARATINAAMRESA